MVDEAASRGCGSLVASFWPHPRAVLQQDARDLRILSTLEEKRRMCLGLGADEFTAIPFTKEFSRLTAREFISEYLRDRFGATAIVIGYDHRIGARGESGAASPEEIADVAASCGVEPILVNDRLAVDGKAVSSTMIRRLISLGEVDAAARLLGYCYPLKGVVTAGNRIGRTIGFPTANLMLYEPLKLVPMRGVYVVRVRVLGNIYRGVCNIGLRPTLNDGRGLIIETHILGFDEEIYGLDIELDFLSRLRDEMRFDSIEALRLRLEEDKSVALNMATPDPVL